MHIRHKFNAVRVQDDGQHFSSKLEHRYYQYLKLLEKSGEVIFFLRQVPFHLPGGAKYVVDFQIFNKDGTVKFIDTKGKETSEFILKKKIVETLYPISIDVIKTSDF